MLTGFYPRQVDTPLRRIKFKDPKTGKRLVFLTNNFALPAMIIANLVSVPMANRTLLQMDQATSPNQRLFRHFGQRVKTQIWIAISVYLFVAIVKKRSLVSSRISTLCYRS